jgi:uncharacterized membrane protein
VSWSLARNRDWRPVSKRILIAAAITLVLMFAFIVTLPFGGEMGPGVLAGLVGRLLLGSYVGWIVSVGRHLARTHELHLGTRSDNRGEQPLLSAKSR